MTESTKTPDRILTYLKMNGEQSASALAKHFGITNEGVRLQLLKLEEEGLIESESSVRGVGRPVLLYRLTRKGSEKFPDNHAALTAQLIHSIRNVLGEEALRKIMDHKQDNDYFRYEAQLEGAQDLEERLDKFTSLRNSEGYMAEWARDEEGYIFIENNCPICTAAASCDGFCRSEIQNIRKLLGADIRVERADHTARGDRRCVYRIKTKF